MINVKNFIIQYLVKKRINRINKIYNKKLKSLKNTQGNYVSKSVSLKHEELWKSLTEKKILTGWLNAYASVNNIEDEKYVPESVYYSIIEPILNIGLHSDSYSDKNFYDLLYSGDVFPLTILRNIDGSFFGPEYMPINCYENYIKKDCKDIDEIVVKPAIESGGGAKVSLFTRSGDVFTNERGEELSLEYVNRVYKENYVFQKVIKQHSFFKEFNPTSLNTIRVLTYKSVKTNKIDAIQSVLRVGAKGSFVDNSRAGGCSIGIKYDGVLNDFATNKYGVAIQSVNSIDLSVPAKVYKYDEIIKLAKKIAIKNLHHRLLGLDMAVDANGSIRCVEVNNSGNEINFFQFNNGPLFGKYTDEVIEYCISKKYKLYNEYTF
ncbi:sugar-transfer associated ATP-grasp domain-containing protein [Rhodohalobacter sp. 8-1]|uniref:sugar-transfer associated ATP-grasp domain-containing protein n=1 Tax=Rhodohalobacter sp. 8-1 TaxID=3131972 RepID=UPI0030EC978A